MGLQKIDDRLASVSKKSWQWMVNQGLKVEYNQWKLVVEESNQAIVRMMLDDTIGFILPLRMGIFIVAKRKPWKKQDGTPFMNRIEHCKTGKVVPQLNLHTFGYYYKIVYIPTKETRFFLHELWQFQATRTVNRLLAGLINSGKDYLTETYKFKHLFSN